MPKGLQKFCAPKTGTVYSLNTFEDFSEQVETGKISNVVDAQSFHLPLQK